MHSDGDPLGNDPLGPSPETVGGMRTARGAPRWIALVLLVVVALGILGGTLRMVINWIV